MIPYKQLSLADIFQDCQNKFDNNKPGFLSLLEKHIDLDAGDEIEFSGKIFSTALGDAWMDVENFKVLTIKKQDTTKK